MGQGQKLAQELDPSKPHAEAMENFRDQLLIVCMKRLADKNGKIDISLKEMDDTYQDILKFSVKDSIFHFELHKKD